MILSNEARAIAYQTGITALGPLVDRIIKLEQIVAALREEISKANAAKSLVTDDISGA